MPGGGPVEGGENNGCHEQFPMDYIINHNYVYVYDPGNGLPVKAIMDLLTRLVT